MALPTPNIDGFSLHVTVYIDADNVSKFFEAMDTVFDKVSQEPELLYFEIFQDPENPGTISWVENWAKSPEKFSSVSICVIVETEDVRGSIADLRIGKFAERVLQAVLRSDRTYVCET